MAKTTAKQPQETLEQLIDARLRLTEERDELEARREELAEKIMKIMLRKKLTEAFGTEGSGYQLVRYLKADYADGAVKYVKKEKLESLFTPEPSVTRSKGMGTLKKDKNTEKEIEKLRGQFEQDQVRELLAKQRA